MSIKNILVVGAGLAGPATCFWLKKYGFSPTLIEKHDCTRSGGYAIDLRGIAVDVARKMGILDEVIKNRRVTTQGLHIDEHGNTKLEAEGEEFGFRQDDDVEIVRGDLVEILMKAIPDVPCRYGMSIKTIVDSDECVTVTYKDGSKESYDLVIAADGMHSTVRKIMFDKEEHSIRDLGHYISVFSAPNFLELNESEVIYENNQRSISVYSPKNSDKALVGLMFPAKVGACNSRNPEEQKRYLKEVFKDAGWETPKLLEYMDKSNDFYFDSIAQVMMPSWTKGRVTLAGDAGYCSSPLSGQGTSLALVGAYLLAGELKEHPVDYSKALRNHEKLLKPFIDANQDFGLWVSQNYLSEKEQTEESTAERTRVILKRIKKVANAIPLKEY